MRLVADFLRVSRRSRLSAMLVVHHFLGLRRQIVLGERVLGRFVVHERDDVGKLLAGEVDLLAERFLLRGSLRCHGAQRMGHAERAGDRRGNGGADREWRRVHGRYCTFRSGAARAAGGPDGGSLDHQAAPVWSK
jgi:hypothetical protein